MNILTPLNALKKSKRTCAENHENIHETETEDQSARSAIHSGEQTTAEEGTTCKHSISRRILKNGKCAHFAVIDPWFISSDDLKAIR